MHIGIGSDHGGFEAKLAIVQHLKAKGHEVMDVGCHGTGLVHYPHYARKVTTALAGDQIHRGILVCTTGVGMSIVANKVRGIRAGLCATAHAARLARAHHDANVLCLGGKTTDSHELAGIVDAFLMTAYEGGRHDVAQGLVRDWEREVTLGIPQDRDIPHAQ